MRASFEQRMCECPAVKKGVLSACTRDSPHPKVKEMKNVYKGQVFDDASKAKAHPGRGDMLQSPKTEQEFHA